MFFLLVSTEKINSNVITNIAPSYISNIYARSGGTGLTFPSTIGLLNVPYTNNFDFVIENNLSDVYSNTLITNNIDMVSGQIDLNNNSILNMSDPILSTDSSNKAYVDTKLSLTGGTMSGIINLNNNIIQNMSTPVNLLDGTNRSYVDTQDALNLSLTGGTMSGVINLNNNIIQNMSTPINPTDGANQRYVNELTEYSKWRYQSFGYVGTGVATVVDSTSNWMSNLGGSLSLQTITINSLRENKYRIQSNTPNVSNGSVSGWLGANTMPVIFPRQGFRVVIGFGLGDTSVNASTRTMIGFFQSNTAPTLNATTTIASLTTQSMGIIQESGESVWSFNTRGFTGSTKVATIIPCTTPSSTWFILEMVNQVNSTDITLTLTDQLTGSVASRTYTCGTLNTMNSNPLNALQIQRNMSSAGGTSGSSLLQTASFRVWSST